MHRLDCLQTGGAASYPMVALLYVSLLPRGAGVSAPCFTAVFAAKALRLQAGASASPSESLPAPETRQQMSDRGAEGQRRNHYRPTRRRVGSGRVGSRHGGLNHRLQRRGDGDRCSTIGLHFQPMHVQAPSVIAFAYPCRPTNAARADLNGLV